MVVLLGLVLLIVPGLVVAARWSLANAAQVAEDLGIEQSLTRSHLLTDGRVLPILALSFAYMLGAAALEFAVASLTLPLNQVASGLAGGLAEALLQMVNVIAFVGVAAMYKELAGETAANHAVENLAAVFD